MIGFVGLSHLGIVSSISIASKGFEVIGYDSDLNLCKNLNQGVPPILEPELPELLADCQSSIRFTNDVSLLTQCQLIYFSLDVPTDEHNQSNLAVLHTLIHDTINFVAPETVLVVLSQVSPGFSRKLLVSLNDRLNGKHVQLFYQVETLIFGRAVERAIQPERYIVGCDKPDLPLPILYQQLLDSFDCPILQMRYESAELTKISINMCLVSSVSTANTLAELCESIGADWSEIVPALRLDKRIGPYAYLVPGLGLAGGNLERDMATVLNLAQELGTDAGIVKSWTENSLYRRDWVLRKLHETVLASMENPTIALWGLAYKPNTKSTKNSPALALLEFLSTFTVRVYDPQVDLEEPITPNFTQAGSALDACQNADVLVITTPWAEFTTIDLMHIQEVMRGQTIIDPFKVFDAQQIDRLGFLYYTLGR